MAAIAFSIQHTIGTRSAAGYLRNRGISLHEAMRLLTGKLIWIR